jgi:uncharacterized protein (DUF2252 family)
MRVNARNDPVVERIRRANEGRDPERLKLKYQAMSEGAFVFLRGTCHLFADDWPAGSDLDQAPQAWICGDLHLENFGTFKGDNRLEYFDINDFDEAALAPCTRDVARLLTSVLLAARSLALKRPQAIHLCRTFIESYVAALEEGKARWIERETSEGMVKNLLKSLRSRKRKDLLDRKTDLEGGRRRIRVDGVRALPASRADRQKVKLFMAKFAARQAEPRFFRVVDVARRIAGTGSLGVERYVILIEGKGSPDKNFLLDLKAAQPSAWRASLTVAQPAWSTEADRVVSIQKRVQAISPALLQAVEIGSTSYVLRELQPVEDRLSLSQRNGKLRRLEGVTATMGGVTAWAHLRSSGRQGASVADSFIEFAKQSSWRRRVLEYAEHYGTQVRREWRSFCKAINAGFFA